MMSFCTSTRNKDSVEISMIETLRDAFFTQNVYFPTFVKSDGQANRILDLVITDSHDRIHHVNSFSPLGNLKQGHIVLNWNYNVSLSNEVLKYDPRVFNYRRADFLGISVKLDKKNWSEIFANKNTNEMYEAFLTEYNKICDLTSTTLLEEIVQINSKRQLSVSNVT